MQGLLCHWFCFTQCWTGLPLLHGGLASMPITPEHEGSACRAIQHCCPRTLLSSTPSLQPAVLELDFCKKLTAAEGDNSETRPLTLHSSSPWASLPPLSSPQHWNQELPLQLAIKNHGRNLHKRSTEKQHPKDLKLTKHVSGETMKDNQESAPPCPAQKPLETSSCSKQQSGKQMGGRGWHSLAKSHTLNYSGRNWMAFAAVLPVTESLQAVHDPWQGAAPKSRGRPAATAAQGSAQSTPGSGSQRHTVLYSSSPGKGPLQPASPRETRIPAWFAHVLLSNPPPTY